MRTEAHQVKMPIVGLAVNQDEIGHDMAVAMIGPFTKKRMINIVFGRGISAASKFTIFIKAASMILLCRPDFSRL